jgi:enoyl-CoA hydratase/carnithine racemase
VKLPLTRWNLGTARPGRGTRRSIANLVAEPGELAAAAESLLDRIATHPRTVTAAQRRLFDIWLNNPLDDSVNASMTEFAKVFESQETHEQIARHHKRNTG